MRKLGAPALVAVALVAGGCGTNEATNPAASPAPPKVREDGRLAVDPSPMTLKDLERYRKRSPERAVAELWFWAQWGSAPNVVGMYDPLIRETLGQSNIAGAYAMLRASFVLTKLEILEVAKGELGTSVLVQARTRAAAPVRHSFLLRPRGPHWRIVHDTLLEEAIASYVQQISDKDPRDAKVTLDAFKQGTGASRNYRDVYMLERLGDARRSARGSGTEEPSGSAGSAAPATPPPAPPAGAQPGTTAP